MVDKNYSLQREDEIKTAVQKMGYVVVPKVVLYDPLLSEKELSVYVTLISRDWTQSRQCFPSVATISKESGVSRSSVKRALSGLIEKGFLTKEKRMKESGAVDSNLYTLKRIDDIYCPEGDYMVLSDEYQERMREDKKGYLIDRVFNAEEPVEDDAEVETVEDKKLKKIEAESEANTDRVLQIFDDVEEKAAQVQEKRSKRKALKNKYGKVRVEGDPHSSVEDKPEKELNVNDVELAWRTAETQAFPDGKYSGNKWDGASRGIAAKLIKRFGADELIEVIEDMFSNWEEYKERYRIRGYPNMKRIAYWADSWFNDIDRGKDDLVRSNRDQAIAQGEYDGVEEDISYAEFGGKASGQKA